jgi:DNA-binding MarR family transcriptional regulator
MHALNFQIKRAHLQILSFGRRELAKLGKENQMTPARFDILYALRICNLRLKVPGRPRWWDHNTFGLTQKALTRILGLSRQTVSKMLLRLEQMGWIEREVALDDARTKNVTLTDLGLQKIWYAMRRIFRGRIFLSAYERLFKPCRLDHVLGVIWLAWSTVDSIARHFGDDSRLSFEFGYVLENDH